MQVGCHNWSFLSELIVSIIIITSIYYYYFYFFCNKSGTVNNCEICMRIIVQSGSDWLNYLLASIFSRVRVCHSRPSRHGTRQYETNLNVCACFIRFHCHIFCSRDRSIQWPGWDYKSQLVFKPYLSIKKNLFHVLVCSPFHFGSGGIPFTQAFNTSLFKRTPLTNQSSVYVWTDGSLCDGKLFSLIFKSFFGSWFVSLYVCLYCYFN